MSWAARESDEQDRREEQGVVDRQLDANTNALRFLRSTARKGARLVGSDVRCLCTSTFYENTTTRYRFACSPGAPSGAGGAESLTDHEWESLLLCSYNLRSVAIGATNFNCGHLSDDERESEELEEQVWGCPTGVGLRGARGLRGTRAGNVRNETSKRARRPSSAPVERSFDKILSQRRQRLSHRPAIASDAAVPAACVRAHHGTTSANGGGAEAGELPKGLVG